MNSQYIKEGVDIKLGGHRFKLLNERALFWPDQRMLIIADAHFGKISHFRKSGASIPVAAIEKQFYRFNGLLKTLLPKKVVFLGDLFHSEYNMEWDFLTRVLQNYPVMDFILVQGNHDILNKKFYQSADLKVTDVLEIENLLFSHDEIPIGGEQFLICGHLHPGFTLGGKGRQRIKLPCLWKSGNKAVLPAYGEFTGLYLVAPDKQDTIYLITDKRIIPIVF
ncbi:MAG: ligase-associated DNA damage response endonuclease PdeM [Thermaurantimonas sp.]